MKTLMISLRAFAAFTVLTGLAYPVLVTASAHLFFPAQAGGSLLERDGEVKGSALLAQEFKSEKYFWPRPSAIKYDAASSGGSNLGPTSSDLAKQVQDRVAAGAVGESRYTSASGLDPHLSRPAVRAQLGRVAKARGLQPQDLARLVGQHVEARQFGFLGQPRVNVLLLNETLDKTSP